MTMIDGNNEALAIELYEAVKDALTENLNTTKKLLLILNKLYHADLLCDHTRFFKDLNPVFLEHGDRCTEFLSKVKRG